MQGGVKKGDKIHGQKKGKKGEAAAYVTRAQASATGSDLVVLVAVFYRRVPPAIGVN